MDLKNNFSDIEEGNNSIGWTNENNDIVYRSVYIRNNDLPKTKSKFKIYISLILITSIISSVSIGGILYAKFTDRLNKQTALIEKVTTASQAVATPTLNSSSSDILNVALTKGSSVTQIAKKVGPSIVSIRMTTKSQSNYFFGNRDNASSSEGSGIIIRNDGYIMTNYHVIQNADPRTGLNQDTILEVFLPDKRQAKAQFIGGDKENDLAVIKISLTNLPVAETGDSLKLEVGELAVAIGNPLGINFAGSVTVGVISALNRPVTNGDYTQNFIQTDAAINPGNSGGALVNSQGQVIGINSAKISQTGVEGLGFAIPINTAKPIIEQLIKFGYIKGRPSTGITGIEVTEAISRYYDLPMGIYVSELESGSGAELAGVEKGDVLLSFGGKTVKTIAELSTILKAYKAGDTVKIVVSRFGSKLSLKMTLGEQN
jgi:serine protease Do